MNTEMITEQPTAEQYLAMEWSCDEKVCPPCGENGEPQWLVWAFSEDGDGPHMICQCGSREAAQAVVTAHKFMQQQEAAADTKRVQRFIAELRARSPRGLIEVPE